jgi:hypothetical protein
MVAPPDTNGGAIFIGEIMEDKTVTMSMKEYEELMNMKKAFVEDKVLVKYTSFGYGASHTNIYYLPKEEALQKIARHQESLEFKIKETEALNQALNIKKIADNNFLNRLRFLFTGELEYISYKE